MMEPAGASLLEREPALSALRAAVAEAAAGHGSTVLLTGEAGIGKTSVIRAFLAALDHRFRVFSGACDDLLAPSTLGPLRDAAQGAWSAAEHGLRELVDGTDDLGMLYVHSVSALGRLLAHRGRPEAEELLIAAWERAVAQRSLLGLAHAGIALVEWAWLIGRSDRAHAVRDVLLARTHRPGAAAFRGELLRYLARAGLGGTDFAGCPEAYAAGLHGDWRVVANEWERIGDPYERALELAESGEPEPTLEALRVLDGFDAPAVAGLVRRRFHDMGGQRLPRGPQPATRANPAGLTARQVDVLALIEQRMTNVEIAQRLVLSVRTVEHHVSAILTKLGAQSRTEAAATAETKIGGPGADMGGRLRCDGPSSLVELSA